MGRDKGLDFNYSFTDAFIYGNLTLKLNSPKNGFSVYTDNYGFEINWSDGRNFRNVLTFFGKIVNEWNFQPKRDPFGMIYVDPYYKAGTPYDIRIQGTYYFK